jgi:hypothetical protein
MGEGSGAMYRGRRRVDSHVFLGADRLWGGRGWLGEGGGATYRGRRRIDSHISECNRPALPLARLCLALA